MKEKIATHGHRIILSALIFEKFFPVNMEIVLKRQGLKSCRTEKYKRRLTHTKKVV